jgi:hypothetical protein
VRSITFPDAEDEHPGEIIKHYPDGHREIVRLENDKEVCVRSIGKTDGGVNLLSQDIWPRVYGATAILTGCGVIWKRRIGVGIRGRAPSFYINGAGAVLIGLLAILFGIYVCLHPHMAIFEPRYLR